MLRLPLLLALSACVAPYGDPAPAHIAPLDGQTAVAGTVPLRAETGGLDLPPDVPVPSETIRVVDLDGGGLVAGEVVRDQHTLRFEPKRPWVAGHTYVWTVSDGPDDTRQLGLDLPEAILGDARFRAGDGDAVLDAVYSDRTGDLCLVLSRTVDGAPDLALTVNDQPVEPTWHLRAEDGIAQLENTLHRDDPGVSLACTTDLPTVEAGTRVRAWWGESGPWSFVVAASALRGVTDPLRRVTP